MKKSVIREELVVLTGNWKLAIVLNQLLYWLGRTKDFSLYIAEVKSVLGDSLFQDMEKLDTKHGWIYKSAAQLSQELMTGWSPSTVLKLLAELVELGYVDRRRNPHFGWDKTYQYRPNIYLVQQDLAKMGFVLDGFPIMILPAQSTPEPEIPIEPHKPDKNVLPPADVQMSVLFAGRVGDGQNYDNAEQAIRRSGWRIKDETTRRVAIHFFAALPEWLDDIPQGDSLRKKWSKGFRDHAQEFTLDELPSLYRKAWDELKPSGLSITWSGAFTTKMLELKQKKNQSRKAPAWFDNEIDPQELDV